MSYCESIKGLGWEVQVVDRGIEPRSPTLQADSLPPEIPGKPSMCESEIVSRSVVSSSLQPYEP